MDHVQKAELRAQVSIAQCEQHVQLLNEEVYARSQGLKLSDTQGQSLQIELSRMKTALVQSDAQGQSLQLELSRMQTALVQEQATLRSTVQSCTRYQDDAVAVNVNYVEALR